ncbi:MAG: hypothetical protein JSR59_13835 [Proteobacteria bacterium]|nr:hypothetical protein [Pseudomonadota bacterium]
MRTTSTSAALARKGAELAMVTPQVVMQRLLRMATAPLPWSQRDRTEFTRMTSEKASAFGEAWFGMWLNSFETQQRMALALWRSFLVPGAGAQGAWRAATHWQDGAVSTLHRGLAPVHRKAVANARRLARR